MPCEITETLQKKKVRRYVCIQNKKIKINLNLGLTKHRAQPNNRSHPKQLRFNQLIDRSLTHLSLSGVHHHRHAHHQNSLYVVNNMF